MSHFDRSNRGSAVSWLAAAIASLLVVAAVAWTAGLGSDRGRVMTTGGAPEGPSEGVTTVGAAADTAIGTAADAAIDAVADTAIGTVADVAVGGLADSTTGPAGAVLPLIADPAASPLEQAVVRYDFKGRLAWYAFAYPSGWWLDPDDGRSVQLSDRSPEAMAALYGRPHDETWAVLEITQSPDGGALDPSDDPAIRAVGEPVAFEIDGLPAVRTAVTDAQGNIDVLMEVQRAEGVFLQIESDIVGRPGGTADALRATLEGIVGSIDLIPSFVDDVAWDTISLASEPPEPLGSFVIEHPPGWAATRLDGALRIVSPAAGPAAAGLEIELAPSSDPAVWDVATDLPYLVFGHRGRIADGHPSGPAPAPGSEAYLFRTTGGVVFDVTVTKPVLSPGSDAYWRNEQLLWLVLQRSLFVSTLDAYP